VKILVLLKEVPDTWGPRRLDPSTGRVDRDAVDPIMDEIGEKALEVGLQYADQHGKSTEVVALTMGRPSANSMLRKALAMGATRAVHVLDDRLSGADMGWTATVLAAAIRDEKPDLVIAGNESTDGRGGVLAVMVAEHLGLPALTGLHSVDIEAAHVQGVGADDTRNITVRAPLPAVLSVSERMPDGRFPSFKGRMTAKKKPLDIRTLSDLGVGDTLAGLSRSIVVSVAETPARQAGLKIDDDGSAAQQLVNFLTERQFVVGAS
jgi:electron transfer flavoprotein beta subunit